ncbi:MAG: nuclear transport factor 2 family protein [Chloroflexi bacterium]|nr:nuclear transport factor 2 family protein [Chloroflexota bacterium]
MDWPRITKGIASSLLLMALAAACGDDDAGPTPTPPAAEATPPSTPTAQKPTATPDPEAEVLAAYERYWEVYAEALRNRDDSQLDEVMTGPRLERGLAEIAELVADGRAVEQVVHLNPIIVEIVGDQAVVLDEYENYSYYVDPATHQPLRPTPSTPQVLRDTVTMQRIDGVWKVFDGIRQESTE